MYIDSLTITALVIFAIVFGLFVRFCVFGLCGGPLRGEDVPPSDGHC